MPASGDPCRILYVGQNIALFLFLKARLKSKGCFLVYCPALWLARTLIESNAAYSLFLFDELSEAAGSALAQLARGLAHRARTPIIEVING
jgi:hypothetical protein